MPFSLLRASTSRAEHARRTRHRGVIRTLLAVLLAAGLLLVWKSAAAAGEDFTRERRLFVEARGLLRAGKVEAFHKTAAELENYPLYPYLVYDYLRPRLWKAEDAEIREFLSRYGDLPMAEDLRQSWLKLLAQRGRWQTYIDNYTPQKDPVLQCYQLLARVKTGSDAYLLEDTRTLWLSGESQPPQCDPAFERLYRSELMTPELVWKRIGLVMEKGGTSLARYLSERLPPDEREWASRWIATWHNPARWTKDPGFRDIPIARTILLNGMRRLALQNVDLALSRWADLRTAYSFTATEKSGIDRLIALRAAESGHRRAAELLDRLDAEDGDERVFHWRLRTALEDQNWDALLRWTAGRVPTDEATRGRWLYWRGRAMEAAGDVGAAREHYLLAARERDYYGFLAADRAGISYDMNDHALPTDPSARQRILERPSILRARELYQLDMVYSARREWQHALESMTTYQMQIAARIAADWGWFDRAILTMGRAAAYDDLELRFPLPYEEKLRKYAQMRGLDLAWLYALVRAESAFMEDARSPTGALGLMQVMPTTGHETARRIGWRGFSPDQLMTVEVNVPIGTSYLKYMLDRFSGNLILATAAYNAGPGSVTRWIPRTNCVEPDIWVEQIPYTETRKYVQRILYYASIYDWRLHHDIVPVYRRMAAVQASAQLVADGGCTVESISMK